MTQWSKRPAEVALLLNPAFCALNVRAFVSGFSSVSERPTDITLIPLVLPIVLHRPTRNEMPSTTKTKFSVWVMNCDILRLNFADRTTAMMPYTREAMLFGLSQHAFKLKDGGLLPLKLPNKKFKFEQESEVQECVSCAEKLGKFIAATESVSTVYSILGIRP